MPECGSQVLFCDNPIRFDTYRGCSHWCNYCFASKKQDMSCIEVDEGVEALKRFIRGERTIETSWCDWNIPLHIGGMSDPLQPAEKKHRRTWECLKVLRDTQYPFILSTKGKLLGDDEYLNLLSECNGMVQVSLVAPIFDKIETGAPNFEERLKIIAKASKKLKRVVIRIQPYVIEAKPYILENLGRYKDAGVYGIIVEGMKFFKKTPFTERFQGDFVYEKQILERDFIEIKAEAHKNNLKFFCGENRLRQMGDSLNCCGSDGLEGFKSNCYNLNHLVLGNGAKPTEAMKKAGSACCFSAMCQTTIGNRQLKKMSFFEVMNKYIQK